MIKEYSVEIELEFDEKPTDQDVWNAARAWADKMGNDFILNEPPCEPFDVPKPTSKPR